MAFHDLRDPTLRLDHERRKIASVPPCPAMVSRLTPLGGTPVRAPSMTTKVSRA